MVSCNISMQHHNLCKFCLPKICIVPQYLKVFFQMWPCALSTHISTQTWLLVITSKPQRQGLTDRGNLSQRLIKQLDQCGMAFFWRWLGTLRVAYNRILACVSMSTGANRTHKKDVLNDAAAQSTTGIACNILDRKASKWVKVRNEGRTLSLAAC